MRNDRPVQDSYRAWAQTEWDSMPEILEDLGLDHTVISPANDYPVFDLIEAPLRLSPSLTPRGDLATSVACEVVTGVFKLGTVCDLPLRPPA